MIVRFPNKLDRYEVAEDHIGVDWFVFSLIHHLEKERPINDFHIHPDKTDCYGNPLDDDDMNKIKRFMDEYGNDLIKKYGVGYSGESLDTWYDNLIERFKSESTQ